MLKSYNDVFICLLTLLLFLFVFFIKKVLNIKVSDFLITFLFSFIYSAEILGETVNFYNKIFYWDFILHFISGFVIAGIGMSIVNKTNKNYLKKSIFFTIFVSFCFSLTISVFWEFFEYIGDSYIFKTDMQKDKLINNIVSVSVNNSNEIININNIRYTIIYLEYNGGISELKIDNGYLDIGLSDTIDDLFANLLGTSFFSLLGFYYLSSNKFIFIESFLIG